MVKFYHILNKNPHLTLSRIIFAAKICCHLYKLYVPLMKGVFRKYLVHPISYEKINVEHIYLNFSKFNPQPFLIMK